MSRRAPSTNAAFPWPSGGGDGLPPGFDWRDDTKLTDYAAQPGDADDDPTVGRVTLAACAPPPSSSPSRS